MARRRGIFGKKETETEVKTTVVEPEVQEPEKKEKKKSGEITIGSKVIVNGRTYGTATLEAPMVTIRNVESTIVGISEDSYEIKEGFVSKDSVKLI